MDNFKLYLDSALGGAGVTSPWWVEWLNQIAFGLGFLTVTLGAVLMGLRVMIAYRDWKNGKNAD